MKDLLENTLGCPTVAVETDAGWLISVVDSGLSARKDRFDFVIEKFNVALKAAKVNELLMIYKLFIYAKHEDSFRVEATLHTRQSDYEGGMHTTYTEVGDAYVKLREIDSEYLMFQDRCGYEAQIIDAGINGFVLDEANASRYKELEYNGFCIIHFKAGSTAAKIGNSQIWTLTFN